MSSIKRNVLNIKTRNNNNNISSTKNNSNNSNNGNNGLTKLNYNDEKQQGTQDPEKRYVVQNTPK